MAGSPNPFLPQSTPAGSTDPAFVPPSSSAGPRPSPPPTRFGPFVTFKPNPAGSTSPTAAPGIPYSPSPATGMTVKVAPKLVWQSVQASSYDVRFGTTNPPPLVSTGQSSPSYNPAVTVNGLYYWQITANNSTGSTVGPLWTFYYQGPPADVVDNSPLVLFDPMPTSIMDISQIRTRAFVSGAGSSLVKAYDAGPNIIEIRDNSMFSDSGGMAITGSQRFHYSGKTKSIFSDPTVDNSGSTSSFVGARTMISVDVNGRIVSGRIKQPVLYKTTFVLDGNESTLSVESNTLAQYPFQVPPPAGSTGLFTPLTGGSMLGDRAYTYSLSSITPDGESFQTGFSVGTFILPSGKTAVQIDRLPIGTEYGGGSSSVRVTGRRLWRTSLKYFSLGGGVPLFMLVATLDNVVTTYIDRASDDTLATPAPVGESGIQMFNYNTTGSKVEVTVRQGPTGTTARKIYRAPVNLFTGEVGYYTLINTINDNLPDSLLSTSGSYYTFLDNVDTGFPLFVSKSVTTPPISGAPPTTPPPFHYFLTGIPQSGPLSIAKAIKAGDNVNIFVQRDNLSAQIALAIIEGGDGIHEAPVISDNSLNSDATCIIRADAELALFSAPIQTVTHATRDPNSRSGSMVTYNLTNPPIHATLMIQEVTMDLIRINNGLAPRFSVKASSVKFSLNDFIRKAVL